MSTATLWYVSTEGHQGFDSHSLDTLKIVTPVTLGATPFSSGEICFLVEQDWGERGYGKRGTNGKYSGKLRG